MNREMTEIVDFLKKYTDGKQNTEKVEISVLQLNRIIKALARESKIGRCKDCKWWKDSNGVYQRGFGAESKCPINRVEVYEGNGYCCLFEPQENG